MQREAVIVSAVRTPVGRYKGSLSDIEAYKLGSIVIKEVINRINLDPKQIDDVILGNLIALPGNVARVAMLEAGLPESIPAMTIDRQCASGLEAINIAASLIMAGLGNIYIAGGTENMTKAPYYMEKPKKPYDINPPKFLKAQLAPPQDDPTMLETAENVAEKYNLKREELDYFAYKSQMKAKEAIESGKFKEEIVPVNIFNKKTKTKVTFDKDESPRTDTTIEKLTKLPPIVKENGVVTAGNSCPLNDGASAVVVMSKEKALEMNLEWLAKVKSFSAAGLSPKIMGMGPLYAVDKLFKKVDLDIEDVDLIELNEAFASQSVACIKELNLDANKVNINGGAIALGHPLGATGAILTTKLLHEMRRRDSKFGLVTMCIGGGQGIATLFER